MNLREHLQDYAKGDNLTHFWRLFRWRERTRYGYLKRILTFFCHRQAHKHGGYIGNGTVIADIPTLPHGLHGIFISRYARIGAHCWIYPNVTIGEIDRKAPHIGDHCLIGAGAVIVGDVHIGDHVNIGAGAVVCTDIPDNCTVVSQPPRILERSRVDDGVPAGTGLD